MTFMWDGPISVDLTESKPVENKPGKESKVKIEVIVYKDGQNTGQAETLRRGTRVADLMRSMARQPSEED